jgi:PAS fold
MTRDLGFPTGLSGQELANRAIAQAQKFGAQLMVAQSVVHIDSSKQPYKVILESGLRELIHPEDRKYVFENAERAIRDGVHIEIEHRLIRPGGEVRIVHSRGDITTDALGWPHQMFGTCQDITERKLAEEALRRSQFYLSEGERLAHMGSWASSNLGIRWSDELDANGMIFPFLELAGLA